MLRLAHILFAIACALGFSLSAASADQSTWEIDSSHSGAHFSVRHMMISNVRGELGKVSGTVEHDPKTPNKTKIEATIDATHIDSRDAKRDTHLKSAEFLDVEKFPTITFRSTKVQKSGASKFKVTGDLNIRGTTKEVVLDVEPTKPTKDPWGNTRIGAVATTKINRKDYGLTWNKPLETGGLLVGDEVAITIDVELVQKASPAP